MQNLLTFFSKKFQHICVSLDVNFKELLTNDVVSFEQLGPGVWLKKCFIWNCGILKKKYDSLICFHELSETIRTGKP